VDIHRTLLKINYVVPLRKVSQAGLVSQPFHLLVDSELRFLRHRILQSHLVIAADLVDVAVLTDVLVQDRRQGVIFAFSTNLLQLCQLISSLDEKTDLVSNILNVVGLRVSHQVQQQVLVVGCHKSFCQQKRVQKDLTAMGILFPTRLQFKSRHALDVWLVRVFKDHGCVYFTFDAKGLRIEFLFGGDGAIVDYSITVLVRLHHILDPLFDVLRCCSQVFQRLVFRQLKLIQVTKVRFHGLFEHALQVIRLEVLSL